MRDTRSKGVMRDIQRFIEGLNQVTDARGRRGGGSLMGDSEGSRGTAQEIQEFDQAPSKKPLKHHPTGTRPLPRLRQSVGRGTRRKRRRKRKRRRRRWALVSGLTESFMTAEIGFVVCYGSVLAVLLDFGQL